MIIALTALAFAMILGGLLAALFGWDIVLIERGWTMVIAGSISAASGALLLGIVAVISRLANIQTELARLQGGLGTQAPGTEETKAPRDLSPAALAGGLMGGSAFSRAGAPPQDDAGTAIPSREDEKEVESETAEEHAVLVEPVRLAESVIPFPSRPAVEPEPARNEEMDVSELKVPDFLLAERRNEKEAEIRTSGADESLFETRPQSDEPQERAEAPDTAMHEDEDVTSAAWPETPVEPEPEPASEPEAAPEEERPAAVVGTYNSGDNKYVMFSNGSIEAQTPRGVFRFKSLDELKEFIASGGETNSSAAI